MKSKLVPIVLALSLGALAIQCSKRPAEVAGSPSATPSPSYSLEPVLPSAPSTPNPPPATPVTPQVTQGPTATDFMTLSTNFIKEEALAVTHRSVPRTKGVARAAANELLKGPNDYERSLDFFTSIPQGVQIRDIAIRDGIAIIDVTRDFESGGGSFSMGARLAQLTFTLTQFSTVDGVELRIEGRTVEVFGGEGLIIDRPMTRDDFDGFLPAILVESPAPGDPVSSPLTVRGLANTFEGEVIARLISSKGAVIATGRGMGMMGDWAPFKVTLSFSFASGPATLQSFYTSPKDGSIMHLTEIPLSIK